MVFHGDLDFFMLFTSVCRPQGHKTTNAPAIMTFVTLFFYLGKTYNQPFLGIFHGDLNLFYLREKSLEMANYIFLPA